MAEFMDTNHIFFIHPSADEHLGCFHFWAILNMSENFGKPTDVELHLQVCLTTKRLSAWYVAYIIQLLILLPCIYMV